MPPPRRASAPQKQSKTESYGRPTSLLWAAHRTFLFTRVVGGPGGGDGGLGGCLSAPGTYILGYQPRYHDEGRLRLGQDRGRAQHVRVGQADGEAQVLGPAAVQRRRDPPGHLAVAPAEEGRAAVQHLRAGGLVHVPAAARRGLAARLVREVRRDGLLELLEGVDGLHGGRGERTCQFVASWDRTWGRGAGGMAWSGRPDTTDRQAGRQTDGPVGSGGSELRDGSAKPPGSCGCECGCVRSFLTFGMPPMADVFSRASRRRRAILSCSWSVSGTPLLPWATACL